MSTPTTTTPASGNAAEELRTALMLDGFYQLGGAVVEPLPELLGYLRALRDLGVMYFRVRDYDNLLALWFRKADGSQMCVVQYPSADDANATDDDQPALECGFVVLAGVWPPEGLVCRVYGGGTLGIWPSEVTEESVWVGDDPSVFDVDLVTGLATRVELEDDPDGPDYDDERDADLAQIAYEEPVPDDEGCAVCHRLDCGGKCVDAGA